MAKIDGTVVDWSKSPRLFWIPEVIDDVSCQDYLDTCRKIHEYNLMNLDQDHLVDGSGKENLGGGEKVGITLTNQNTQIAFTPNTTFKSSGTATSADVGTTLIDIAADFITDGVEAGALLINLTDGSLCGVISVDNLNTISHTQLGGGSGNDWGIGDNYKIWNTVQKTVLGGNLVAVDDIGVDMTPIFPTPLTQVIVARSASGTLQELDAIRYASYGGGVSVDITSSYNGTVYPVGNIEFPVNNIIDAISIANSKGFNTLFIRESMTLDNGTDLEDFNIIGGSRVNTFITVASNALTQRIEFRSCNISGTLDGACTIENCSVGDLIYINGQIRDSGLCGTIVLNGNEEAVIANCYMIDQDIPPIVDMGGSGQDLVMVNYCGMVTIKNLTSPTEELGVGLNAGEVILDSTITAGKITICGIGKLVDNATSYTSLDKSGLISNESIADAVWDEPKGFHTQSGSFGKIVQDMETSIIRLLGLHHENYKMDTIVRNGNDLMTSAKVRIYTDVTLTVELETYTVTVTYDGDNITSHTVVLD